MSKKLVLLVSAVSFLFIGCTRYANEEELKLLDDTKKGAAKAEKKLTNLKKERRSLEDELAQKEKELRNAEEEKAAVSERLGE